MCPGARALRCYILAITTGATGAARREAVAAIDRLVVAGLEGHLRLLAAAIAADGIHLALGTSHRGEGREAALPILAGATNLAALLAAAGIVGEAARGVELLLTDRKRKRLTAVTT